MRGGPMAPRVMRNGPFVRQRALQPLIVRSAANLTREVRAQAQQLSGHQIRQLRSSSNPHPTLTESTGRRLLEDMADLLGDLMDQHQAREDIAARSAGFPTRRDQYGRIAESQGLPRDADGNVIQVDEHDRPYVYVNAGEIVYVKVYKARITPKGVDLDAKCTVSSPDGKEEVLLVEELPTIHLPTSLW